MSRPKPFRQAVPRREVVARRQAVARQPSDPPARARPVARQRPTDDSRRDLFVAIPIIAILAVVVVVLFGGQGGSAAPGGLGTLTSDTAVGTPGSTGPTAPGSPGDPIGSAPPTGSTTPPPTEPGATPPLATPTPTAIPVTSSEPEALTGYIWPLRNARITAFFEHRDEGFIVIDGQRVHEGLDIASFCGDHVRAAHSGTVLAAGRRAVEQMGFSGSLDPFFTRIDHKNDLQFLSITVVIDDGNGYRSVYAHLNDTTVEAGDVVAAGDQIGWEGDTGQATGCHLHYEVDRMDGPWQAIANEFVEDNLYPPFVRERVDPMRILSLDAPSAPSYAWNVLPPRVSPGLDHPTAPHDDPNPIPTATPEPSPSGSPEPSSTPKP